MKRRREPWPSRRERATAKLRYWYGETPTGIEDAWSDASSNAAIPEGAVERFRTEPPRSRRRGPAGFSRHSCSG